MIIKILGVLSFDVQYFDKISEKNSRKSPFYQAVSSRKFLFTFWTYLASLLTYVLTYLFRFPIDLEKQKPENFYLVSTRIVSG